MSQEGNLQTQTRYLEGEIGHRVLELHKKVKFWRRRAFAARIITAVLGAVISVIAGWKGTFPFSSIWTCLPTIFHGKDDWILIFGALVTVLNAWSAFFNHRDLWVSNAAATDRLRALLARLRFESKGAAFDEDALKKLFEEYHIVLSDTTQRWTEINTP